MTDPRRLSNQLKNTYMQNEGLTTTKKSTAMDSLLMELQEQVKAFEGSNDRLRKLSNGLEAEPPKESAPEAKEPEKFAQGILYGLSGYISSLKENNRYYDYLLNRIEHMI